MKMRLFVLPVIVFVLMSLFISSCSRDNTNNAKNEEKTYKFVIAHSTAEATSLHVGLEKFTNEIEQKSNGKINAELYPNAQLGADRALIEAVQMGDVTIMASSTAPAVNFVPDLSVFDLPFLFPTKEVAREVLNGPFFNRISNKYEQAGFKLLGFADQGFRKLTLSGKKVTSPDDLKGVKIRTMENPYHMAAWKALGANPTPLAFNEVYTALQQNTVQGQENPLELIVSQKFYEQQDYVINTNHIFQAIQVIMNLDAFNALPENLQMLVEETMQEAIDYANEYQDNNELEYRNIIENAGLEIMDLTPEQLAPFKEKTKVVYDQIKENVDNEVYNLLLQELDRAVGGQL